MATRAGTRVRRSGATRRASARRVTLWRGIADAFAEHNLLTYAAATSFQALVALVPLTLLGLALLGALGLGDTWRDSIAPRIEGRVTPPVYDAIDFSVKRVLESGTAGVIAFALVLSLWYLAAAMRPVMEALNKIHDVDDKRPGWIRLAVSFGLGALVAVATVGSALVIIAGPRAGGAADTVLGVGRWLIAVVVLMILLGLIVRIAPAEHPEPRWASAGSVAIVLSWLVATLLFKLWVQYIANFKSPVGSLLGLLLLTGYLFVSAIVFLAGVQLDELLRKRRR